MKMVFTVMQNNVQFVFIMHWPCNKSSPFRKLMIVPVNPSDLSIMLVKKQMKYFDVPLEHAWTVPVLQELLNTRMNNLYVQGFDDYVITEMINILCNE